LWSPYTSGIASAVLLGEVAILGGAVKRARHNRPTLSTGKKVRGIQAVGMKAIRAGVGIYDGDEFLLLP
jgi:hypothetical protein